MILTKLAFVSNGSAPTGDSGRSYLCGLVRLTSACFIVLTLELLILLQTTVFTLINYLHGMEKYNEYNTELGKVIHFPYLLPLLIFQVIWLMSIVASFVSVPTMLPYLMLPHIFLSIVSLLTAIALVALTVYYTFKGIRLEWPIILLIALPSVFMVTEIYCLYVTFACFRWLVHKKKSVRATDPDKATPIDAVDAFDTYSRRIRLEWPIILLIALPSVFMVTEIYCLYVTFACFRWLVHKKKSVRATDPDKATPIDAVDAFDTYSRRSTVVINDDYLYIPT
ncbi:hypothetical protein Tcan_08765 [Toxocara canis]|uniref:Transmembrane protein n=1 Tax=Toxocara canis TaxID=6265 RepID=A0A0B2UZC2_TOXCA|nr:hypothetical protein Tcan_08765 [Toxocara canis]